jgi:hypothetical protein
MKREIRGRPPTGGASMAGSTAEEEERMARFTFALGVEGELRDAGVVQSDSFDEALVELSRRYRPQKGDVLEIGVAGFPPARYTMAAALGGIGGWQPANRQAA